MDTVIRKATDTDLPSIQALNQELFRFEHQWNDTYLIDWPYSPQGIKFFSERIDSHLVFVAEQAGMIVGYICGTIWDTYSFRTSPNVAEIENMFVSPKIRGGGIGKKLFQTFEQEAKQRGAKFLQVTSFTKNLCAAGFYQHIGLTPEQTVFEKRLD